MQPQGRGEVTGLLRAWRGGDQAALQSLIPLLENELHGIARHCMARQPPGQTLQPTALVNEVYLRLVGGRKPDLRDRSHFLAVCTQIMRHILVDHARARQAAKRGGPIQVNADAVRTGSTGPGVDLMALDEALDGLARVFPRKARVIELRFFCGLSVEETAALLAISEDTVMRDWRLARAWLARQLSHQDSHGPGAIAQT